MAITKIPAAGFTGNNFRNIIINGDMSIAQRGTSFTSITANTYTLDRWLTSGTGYTLTITQDTDVPTGQGFAKSTKLQVTTANASPSAGDNLQYQTRFEGQMLQYLKFGTSSAESLTMSFWVKSNLTGVYCTEFQNDDNDKTRGANFTISSANTWEKKTITISGDTASGFTNDNNRSMRLSFGLMSGSNTTGTNDSIANWVTRSSNLTSIYPNLGVNFCSSTSNYINITGVQLEAGTSASDFEFLPVDVNLERCQRYCEVYEGSSEESQIPQSIAQCDLNNRAETIIHYTRKRASPTISVNTVGNLRVCTMANTNATPVNFNTYVGTGLYGANIFCSVASGVSTNSLSGIIYLTFNGSAKITIDSEL